MKKYFSFFNSLLLLFSSRFSLKHHRHLHRRSSNNSRFVKLKSEPEARQFDDITDHFDLSSTLVFSVEDVLLRSDSLFPYFMLVAFEAGGPIRALVLFLVYPIICLLGHETGLKVMVMVSFSGIKEDEFRVGSAVLSKFLLEDVGLEGFEIVKKCKRTTAVSCMPRVMVESFLKDYLEIDHVVGRELKVFGGYFIGLMEDKKKVDTNFIELIGDGQVKGSIDVHCQNFPICKEVYWTGKADKSKWHTLPKSMYPKPLIFHDGRLATKPTPEVTLAILIWAPFGFILALLRGAIFLSFPLSMSCPILAFMGIHTLVNKPNMPSKSHPNTNPTKGHLYVCNHRTLLDPLFVSTVASEPLTAVTYSLSRLSEILSPIKTIRLSRSRDQDAAMMHKTLEQGSLVVCPEGTTCREPYLLRFSPLFSEMSNTIMPVALDSHVTMFYGTTAGGLKCLDPLFFLMNPHPSYTVQLLESMRGSPMNDRDRTRFDVANLVQGEIGKALGFECTRLTRKDKYLILAGNEGIISQH